VAEILARLEADPVELREQVLAKALLAQIDQPLEEMLQRGLVFKLPVPREAIATVCETISNLEQHINRAVALGLLEVSHDSSLRVPRILPLKVPENAEAMYKQAAEVLYRLWWEETESSTEEQRLEIHQLALRGKAEDIAVNMVKTLAIRWIQQSRFREAVQLCKSTLEVTQDYRVLNQLARSEQELGEVGEAQQYYQQALDNCPQPDETEKATIIHNLAILKADQGDINQALVLYQQSLELDERIGYVPGKAATLHCLAVIYDNQGDIKQALALFQQSLELIEGIGNIQGKAATLHCLAVIYANQGDINQALALYQQSLELKEGIGDVQGKAATLYGLARIYANQGDINQALALFQQSLELTEGIGNVKGKAATLHELARIYANQGDINQALALFQQSLELDERIGDVQGKAATLHELARIYANQGDISQALALVQQSMELDERIGNVQGDFDVALDYLQQALEILQRLQSPDAEREGES